MWCAPAPAGFIDRKLLAVGAVAQGAHEGSHHGGYRQPPLTADASDLISAFVMRAEITAIVEDIKQSLGLLRRHL
jgi:hypothetical protein